ncbi:metabotropic glutamate receptor 3-like [Octopus vulgaris]|uniref:Metabotropic glutamate receptor 3-like n=2 Tax=Octopus TaxID=6643 RepID=A0AA36F8D2_OCTVU|nr:metabotropic glutamate receptor 3 [Octopus sinensis]XP_036362935.1 metabotropic glutamate receptor 3 [Octopus sinensis]XP_036362936.1 metabotropic glutamate receptor 3 [Octopus sinensis]XP_036362937.1 metabotropic glutamate receptor 3 [Octopus sinensis]CAI9729621.1 metabotropic glutamate receptor 3-like [Octopus vulgaris]
MNSRRKLRRLYFSLVLTILVWVSFAFSVAPDNKTGKALIPGDIILGGLFPVHQKGEGDKPCGEIDVQRAIQRLEAMLFTVDHINQNASILPGIKLGAAIHDTCARATYALEQSLEFVRASISTLDASEFECEDGSRAKAKYIPTAVAGVIGGSSSSVSLQVANLLRLFHIPQISYASTSAALSDKTRFDYFVRTVPPDTFQAIAMVELVQAFNWTYVSTVASQGDYGESGIDYFQQEARLRNICIATTVKIPTNSKTETFKYIIRRLLEKKNARVVILFVRIEDATSILESATRMNVTNHFVWIASDAWGRQPHPVKNNEKVAEGALTIELTSTVIPQFDDYFQRLDPYLNTRNPWFTEYWEKVHNCKWKTEERSVPLLINEMPRQICNGDETLEPGYYKQEGKVQFIYDAVYAMALAIHRMQQDVCPRTTKLCERMKKIDGEVLLKKYLLNTSFYDGYGALVQFDKQGDALGRYSIFNYAYDNLTGQYAYKHVGTWGKNHLELTGDEITWSGGTDLIPMSRCSRPCNYDEVKSVHDTCCWICIKCEDWEYLYDEYSCRDCGLGRWPNATKRSCFSLELQHMTWNSIYAIVPLSLSCLGIIGTVTVMVTFVRYNDTPVVMASGRELSYMLLSGCLFCYLMSFILIAKPSMFICSVQRIGVGFGFAIIYSALLTKTNRISRIFYNARRSARRPPFISPRSQIAIASILISIQIVFTVIWLVLEPPGTRHYFPYNKRNEVILKCKTRDISFLVSLIYNMLLIIICTVYAVKTRNIPENFNESKFIGFSMYTTCIIWLAFVPIYFGTLNAFQIQITTLCISISLSASVALLCLFVPKMYIILFHPEKNVRKLIMNSATYKRAPTSSATITTATNHGTFTEHIKLNVQNSAQARAVCSPTDIKTDKDSVASL